MSTNEVSAGKYCQTKPWDFFHIVINWFIFYYLTIITIEIYTYKSIYKIYTA